jgi:argininosuccinate lyase
VSEARLWGGRFRGSPAEAFEALNESLSVDRRLWREDIDGSRAHARMLGATGILGSEDVSAILAALDRTFAEMETGTFAFAPADEDIHTAVERRVTELAGDAGRRLHTGRSRNDQVATDMLLWIGRTCDAQAAALRDLALVLVDRAGEHIDTILPGYTHTQRAQPVRLAHHLLAYVWMLARDRRRLTATREAAAAECPLGSGALSGSGFPVDRGMVAEELGFERPSPNSLDAVASRDAHADYLHFAAQLGVHLSRLGAELVWWSTEEFGFVELPDAFTSGSSMLPQKKNPDAAEMARAKAHRLAADAAGLAGVTAGLPLTYNKDLQEDKVFLFDAADTVDLLLPAMTGMVAGAQFRVERMAAACAGGAMAATDLADHLVRLGWPFRTAHEAVGSLVRTVLDRAAGLDEATPEEIHAAGLGDIDLPDLSVAASVEAKDVPGGTARGRVVQQLDAARTEVSGW